jgi:hypothetical protein
MRKPLCITGKSQTALYGFVATPKRAGVRTGAKLAGTALLLAAPCLATQIDAARAQPYVGGTITFSNQMPTGVLIYKCTGSGAPPSPLCDSQQQLINSGYVTPVPPQNVPNGAVVDPAPEAFLYATGSYVLWQHQKSNPTAWNSCILTVDPQAGVNVSNNKNNNCPGLVWVNDKSDPVVSINLYNNAGYIMPDVTTYSPSPKLTAPSNPRLNQPPFAARAFTVKYTGTNEAICLNLLGTFNQTPCSTDPNDIPIQQGQSYAWIYKGQQNFCNPNAPNTKCPRNGPYTPSSVFVISGIKFPGESRFTPVGQQGGTNPYTGTGYTAYGGRFEFAFYPQTMPSTYSPVPFQGGTLSTGVSTVDMSLVNGYNFGFTLYPTQPTICAISQQERGPSHYYLWSASNLLSTFVAKTSYCPSKQAVTVPVNGAKKNAGCQGDGTFATNTNSPWADAYACNPPSYNLETTCPPPASDPPPYDYTPAPIPPGAPNPWRPYSQNLAIGKKDPITGGIILYNAYTWPFQDFRGTFTCDGDAQNYLLEISDPQP